MFCQNCGKEIPDGSINCSYCGKALTTTPAREPITYSPRRKKIFGYAIAAVVCSTTFTIIGMILGKIAWSMGAEDLEIYKRDWMVRAGKIAGKVAFFLSIGMTIFWVLYILIIVFALATKAGRYY